MLNHQFSSRMIAVLQETQEAGSCSHDETLQYLFLLLSKMALNTLVLSFWLRSISRSFFGIFSLSVYLADLLLITFISWTWWFREEIDVHRSMCFSLSHGSAVYSALPLPVLLVGTLDYAAFCHTEVHQNSASRTAGRCVAVLLTWTLAFFYSFCYTKPDLLTIQYREGVNALVCPVQDSAAVSYFNLSLTLLVGAVLLLSWRRVPHWVRLINNLGSKRAWLVTPKSDLAFSKRLEKLREGTADRLGSDSDQQCRPPLLVSLTLCFALNWTPYLTMSVVCDLLGFAVPAYATINLLWTACANSLLAGLAFWCSSDECGPLCKPPDDICTWSFYWHLSQEGSQWSGSKKQRRLSSLSEKLLRHV